LQLDPSIPVYVVGKGKGEAVGWIDYGKEDNLIWIVAIHDTGEVWCAPNPDIRFLNNYSIGRKVIEKEHEKD
jgi:hypothetical protein